MHQALYALLSYARHFVRRKQARLGPALLLFIACCAVLFLISHLPLVNICKKEATVRREMVCPACEHLSAGGSPTDRTISATIVSAASPPDEKSFIVHIAMSVCGDRGSEALVSLKSAVLLMNVKNVYAISIFTDGSHAVERAFSQHVRAYNKSLGEAKKNKNVQFYFYKIDMSTEIQFLFRRCSANRLIIPLELAKLQVSPKYIYVDTDVIWLEDPAIIFKEFSKFDEVQQFGFAYEVETSEGMRDNRSYYHKTGYRLPIFGPNGINAGVALFRVKDAVRTCGELVHIARKYKSKMRLGDQDVLNFYGHYNQGHIFRLGCQFNRRTNSKCDIYTGGILHGNRGTFHQKMKVLNEYPLRYNLVKTIPLQGFDAGISLSKRSRL